MYIDNGGQLIQEAGGTLFLINFILREVGGVIFINILYAREAGGEGKPLGRREAHPRCPHPVWMFVILLFFTIFDLFTQLYYTQSCMSSFHR